MQAVKGKSGFRDSAEIRFALIFGSLLLSGFVFWRKKLSSGKLPGKKSHHQNGISIKFEANLAVNSKYNNDRNRNVDVKPPHQRKLFMPGAQRTKR